jgi:hypothetical protein
MLYKYLQFILGSKLQAEMQFLCFHCSLIAFRGFFNSDNNLATLVDKLQVSYIMHQGDTGERSGSEEGDSLVADLDEEVPGRVQRNPARPQPALHPPPSRKSQII